MPTDVASCDLLARPLSRGSFSYRVTLGIDYDILGVLP